MPHKRVAGAIVDDWRAVKRDIQAVEDGPIVPSKRHAELTALHAEARRLRREYQQLIEEAREHHRSLPPPFPSP